MRRNIYKSKRNMAVMLSLFFVAACVLFVTTITKALDLPTSGYCGADDGKNVQWSYDKSTNTLMFTGSGKMAGYSTSLDDKGWGIYYDSVKKVVVGEGITEVGSGICSGFLKIQEVVLPESLKKIGCEAFNEASTIKKLEIPNGVNYIGHSAFRFLYKIDRLHVPGVKNIEASTFAQMGSSTENGMIFSMDEGVEKVDSLAFSSAKFNTLYLPSTYSNLWNTEFENLQYLYGKNEAQQQYAISNDVFYIDATQTFDIKDAISIDLEQEMADYYLYTGTKKVVKLTYKHNGVDVPLNEGFDYTVEYSDNINPGKCTATITGIGCYTGTKTVEFDIYVPIESCEITKSENSYTYDGTEKLPVITVKYKKSEDDEITFVEGEDYTATLYDDNINAGITTITVRGIGGVKGTTQVGFTINKKNIEDEDINFELENERVAYDGEEKTPNVTVKQGEKVLEKDTDYTVDYFSNIEAGPALVRISGINNYTGMRDLSFRIYRDLAKDFDFQLEYDRVAYDGTPKTPTVAIRYNNEILNDADYTVEYSSNTEVGTGYVTVTGVANYGGEKKLSFEIYEEEESKTSINACEVTLEYDRVVYDGTAKTPSVIVKNNDEILTKDTDYTLIYTDNIMAGNAVITLSGMNNYTGTRDINFTIYYPISILACNIKLEYNRVAYDGTAKTPTVTVKYNDNTLTKDTDYTIEYSGNTAVGTGYVTVTGIGDYTEEKQLTFEIYEEEGNKTSISDCNVILEYDRVAYDGTAKTPEVTVKYNNETLAKGTDYTVVYSNNTAVGVGTATVTITGIGSYENAKDVTFTIYEEEEVNKTSIKDCDVTLEYDRVAYNGTAKKPTVTVKYNGSTLAKDTDYTVAYSNNTAVGTATVTITGIGNYDNTKEVTFTIYEEEVVNKTSIKDCSFTLEYNQVAYDGTAKTPSVTVKYNNKTLTKDNDYTVAYSANKEVGTAQVTIKGINDYSEQKILEFEIYDDNDYLKLNTPNSIQVPRYETVSNQFKIEKNGRVEISFVPVEGEFQEGGPSLYKIDADDNEVRIDLQFLQTDNDYWYHNTDKEITTQSVRLVPGVYIIKFSNYYPVTINLTIKFTEESPDEYEIENNNSFSAANSIILNKEYKGNIRDTQDEDYYKIELKQEGSLYVNLRNTGTVAELWKVELYNENINGNRELINSWYNTTNKNSRFTKYRLPTGVYYIKVSKGRFMYDSEWEAGEYSIGTVYVAETKDKSEIEYNDSYETANNINVNSEYAGNIPTDKDIDYYTFTLEEDSDVSVQLKQENDEITNCLYKVILYRKNDDGVLVVFDSFLSDSKTLSTGSDISIPAGKYYLCVKNNNGMPEDKNDYKIKINQQKAKEAVTLHGSPKDVAGQSGTPISVNSTVVANDKENRFIFNIAKSGRVSLSAVPHSYEYGVKGYIAFYKTDEDENEILLRGKGTWNGGEYKSVEEINTATEILSPGTYIVICEDLSQAALTVNYEELPDLSESKIAAVSDQIYTGENITPKLSITYKGKVLVENRDYTAVYSNNISAGTASVMIKSVEGASVGSNQTSFKILKREISVPVAQQTEFVYDKTEKQIVISSDDSKFLIAENDKAVNAGTYKASYNIDTNNCVWKDNHTGPVQIEWIIKKATADITVTQTAYEKEQDDGTFTLDGITTSSDGVIAYSVKEGTDVITVNEAGLVTILKPGKAVISVKVKESSNYTESLEKTINVEVKAYSVGSEIKVGNAYFEVTASSGSAHTVEFIEPDKNSYTSYTIPTTVTSDSGEVYIVTAVSKKAFYNNKKLKQVTIPSTIKSIGSNAFSGCTNLTKVKVGAGVETIGEAAFKNCTKLTSIILPKTVTKIEKNTFNGCKKLKSITIKSNKVIKIGANAFKGVSNKCVIKVPRKLVKKYKKVLTKKTGFKKGMKIKKI